MENFTLEQLGLFITLMGGTLSAIIVACFKSRCKNIKTPCISCDREEQKVMILRKIILNYYLL